jgi:hypothetical protein
VRTKKSKRPSKLKETTRAADDALRRELEQADPEKFKRMVRPLFRSSKTDAAST